MMSLNQKNETLSFNDRPINVPPLLNQEDAVRESFNYMEKRMKGDYTIIKTFSSRLDKAIGYFELNTMVTISALSGGGKSTLSKRLINSIVEDLINQNKEVICLSFNFEMLAHKTIARELSNRSSKTLRELYSIDKPLRSDEYQKLYDEYFNVLANFPIKYVEEPQDYTSIKDTIYYYWTKLAKPNNKIFIVEIDHAMITRGKDGDSQKDRLDNLMENLNVIKKRIAAQGGQMIIFILSQMNRDIKSENRRLVPELQYPTTSDLFAASAIEFFSDYIIIAHNPSKLNLKSYTEYKYPIFVKESNNDLTPFIYFHILKNRDGIPDITIPYLSRLNFFDFEEVSREDFKVYHDTFLATKTNPNRIHKTII
jgi:replicative DNA helicase